MLESQIPITLNLKYPSAFLLFLFIILEILIDFDVDSLNQSLDVAKVSSNIVGKLQIAICDVIIASHNSKSLLVVIIFHLKFDLRVIFNSSDDLRFVDWVLFAPFVISPLWLFIFESAHLSIDIQGQLKYYLFHFG